MKKICIRASVRVYPFSDRGPCELITLTPLESVDENRKLFKGPTQFSITVDNPEALGMFKNVKMVQIEIRPL